MSRHLGSTAWGLGASSHNPTWRDQARCIGADPDIWFALPHSATVLTARKICAGCPVRLECAKEAVERGDDGIRGGWTIEERRAHANWGLPVEQWPDRTLPSDSCDECQTVFWPRIGRRDTLCAFCRPDYPARIIPDLEPATKPDSGQAWRRCIDCRRDFPIDPDRKWNRLCTPCGLKAPHRGTRATYLRRAGS